MKEIAVGLENSGQRFLWVVRNPPPDKDKEPKLDELLPKGFLERTKDRGFVMKQWAPQVEVLSHDSVGRFVTHYGWNLVLEVVCGGVQMIGWPLYAKQRMNMVIMVKDLKVALAVNESENGCVSGEELEKWVRELMDSEEGKEVRKRSSAMRDDAAKAMGKGGSSHNDF
ncbi:anthocyanidin 5,3-O-glucosyltransferase-like [Juglans microcarpa x Juglans regia]|uniref:anthocyanidin 5,3-O-glucosyltransferase-like n=1 Tax=Juglans microcarpa x Juglans regia TaxID=2249226 RepID=UPI001B7F068E|nr:anthocyanidin 5,3-O-glucosyltransferase-like [Juglans microcarpa x Juglans regia]